MTRDAHKFCCSRLKQINLISIFLEPVLRRAQCFKEGSGSSVWGEEMQWVRICRGADVQFLTGVLQWGEETKESLGEDKYLVGYLRCCPEMVISLPSSFFLCFRSRKGHAWLMLAQRCGVLDTYQDRKLFPGQLS